MQINVHTPPYNFVMLYICRNSKIIFWRFIQKETRRQVYVYRKGRWGLCVCMLVRGRVLVIKVSENSCKWLQERGMLYQEHVCEKDTSGEGV